MSCDEMTGLWVWSGSDVEPAPTSMDEVRQAWENNSLCPSTPAYGAGEWQTLAVLAPLVCAKMAAIACIPPADLQPQDLQPQDSAIVPFVAEQAREGEKVRLPAEGEHAVKAGSRVLMPVLPPADLGSCSNVNDWTKLRPGTVVDCKYAGTSGGTSGADSVLQTFAVLFDHGALSEGISAADEELVNRWGKDSDSVGCIPPARDCSLHDQAAAAIRQSTPPPNGKKLEGVLLGMQESVGSLRVFRGVRKVEGLANNRLPSDITALLPILSEDVGSGCTTCLSLLLFEGQVDASQVRRFCCMVEPSEPYIIHFSRVMAKSPARCMLLPSNGKFEPVADDKDGLDKFAELHAQRALSILRAAKMTAANLNNRLSQGPVSSQNLDNSPPYHMRTRDRPQQDQERGIVSAGILGQLPGQRPGPTGPTEPANSHNPSRSLGTLVMAGDRAALFKELAGIGRVAMHSMTLAQLMELCKNRNLVFDPRDVDQDTLIAMLVTWKKSKPPSSIRTDVSSDEETPTKETPIKLKVPSASKVPPVSVSKKEQKEQKQQKEQQEIAIKKREDAEYEDALREREAAVESMRKRRVHAERMQRLQQETATAESAHQVELPPKRPSSGSPLAGAPVNGEQQPAKIQKGGDQPLQPEAVAASSSHTLPPHTPPHRKSCDPQEAAPPDTPSDLVALRRTINELVSELASLTDATIFSMRQKVVGGLRNDEQRLVLKYQRRYNRTY